MPAPQAQMMTTTTAAVCTPATSAVPEAVPMGLPVEAVAVGASSSSTTTTLEAERAALEVERQRVEVMRQAAEVERQRAQVERQAAEVQRQAAEQAAAAEKAAAEAEAARMQAEVARLTSALETAKAEEEAAVVRKDYGAAQRANEAAKAAEAALRECQHAGIAIGKAMSSAVKGAPPLAGTATGKAMGSEVKGAPPMAGTATGKTMGSAAKGGAPPLAGRVTGTATGDAGPITLPISGHAVETAELPYYSGCLCNRTMIYTDTEHCIGCEMTSEYPCYKESFCLKPGVEPFPVAFTGGADDGTICELSLPCQKCALRQPAQWSPLLQGRGHSFCFLSEGTFPPPEDATMTCGTCGVSILPRVTVLKTMGEVVAPTADDASQGGAAAASADSMQRV